jgi:hypothetical protein
MLFFIILIFFSSVYGEKLIGCLVYAKEDELFLTRWLETGIVVTRRIEPLGASADWLSQRKCVIESSACNIIDHRILALQKIDCPVPQLECDLHQGTTHCFYDTEGPLYKLYHIIKSLRTKFGLKAYMRTVEGRMKV